MPLKPSPGSAVSLSVKSIFSQQSCDTIKYLFLLSVWAGFLTAGRELINNVIKTPSPCALSPSSGSGWGLHALNCPGSPGHLGSCMHACVPMCSLSFFAGHLFGMSCEPSLWVFWLFAKGNIHLPYALVREPTGRCDGVLPVVPLSLQHLPWLVGRSEVPEQSLSCWIILPHTSRLGFGILRLLLNRWVWSKSCLLLSVDVRVLGKERKRVQLQSGENVFGLLCAVQGSARALSTMCVQRSVAEYTNKTFGKGGGSHVSGNGLLVWYWSTKIPLSLSQTLGKTGVLIHALVHSSVSGTHSLLSTGWASGCYAQRH